MKTNIDILLKKAIEYRKDLFNDISTTAFRIVNGSADNLEDITIDYYDNHILITWYTKQSYKIKNILVQSLQKILSPSSIYQKKRFGPRGTFIDDNDDFISGNKPSFPIVVKQDNIKYAVYLDDGAMTGVFLDQRETRNSLKNLYTKNKTVLNTFSYTGAFSVASALGDAKHTTSVDLAKRSLKKTKEQFKVNNITDLSNHKIIVQDVFEYFKYAIKKDLKFDIVIADPPSFARSKKYSFSVAKDYKDLLKQIIQITNKHGLIVASTNYSKISIKNFKGFVNQAFSELKLTYKIQKSFSLPKDFKIDPKNPQSNYLKVLFIEKL